MDKLELLSLAKDYSVKKHDDGYRIECKNADLAAYIDEDYEIEYYVTNVYNSCSDYAKIDMEELMTLQKFCELIIK